jgi:hypothetical protein
MAASGFHSAFTCQIITTRCGGFAQTFRLQRCLHAGARIHPPKPGRSILQNHPALGWPANHGVGKKPIEKVLMEPRLGGRWLEIAEDGTQTVVATITHWELGINCRSPI